MLIAPPPPDARPEALAPEEQQRLAHAAAFQGEGTGYQAIQGTKPQTLAYGLTDSPAGLAAWIVEKFRAWADCRGDVESVFTRDELLTNLTRLLGDGHHQLLHAPLLRDAQEREAADRDGRIEVPTGVAVFPKELYNAPRAWAERYYNVTHWSVFAAGGHFAAHGAAGRAGGGPADVLSHVCDERAGSETSAPGSRSTANASRSCR